jgi:hypothetical protein
MTRIASLAGRDFHMILSEAVLKEVEFGIDRFVRWLDHYGETSYDFQSVYASDLGRAAKAFYYRKRALGTLAVSPMVLCEAFMPSARKLFWKPQRFPIADAHYAMGFAFLASTRGTDKQYQRAIHFLQVLEETRCRGYEDYCWGYPFNWETITGTIKEGTPLITTIPYVYEAFAQAYDMAKNQQWLRIMRSIAKHVFHSYRDVEISPDTATCGYTPAPDDPCRVINASAYRAFLLTKAGRDLSEPRYSTVASKNLNFVLAAQNADGSWFYSADGKRDFVDHFHTCFVLKALVKIQELTGCPRCASAIERGVAYYVRHLFDADGLPMPFSKAPRFTIYRRELYDYAECINLAVLLNGRFPELDRLLGRVIADLFSRWQRADGSFRTRQLLVGWDNVPMHRWAQSQVFRSLCFFLSRYRAKPQDGIAQDSHLLLPSRSSSLENAK